MQSILNQLYDLVNSFCLRYPRARQDINKASWENISQSEKHFKLSRIAGT